MLTRRQMIADGDEPFDRQSFGTKPRIDAKGNKVFGLQPALQGVAQGFTPLPKSGCDDAREALGVVRPQFAIGARNDTNERRFDFRRRIERVRRYDEERFHREAILQHHRQAPVFRSRRRRDHTLYDFFLQHESHVADRASEFSEIKQQRRRDIVGKISDNAKICAEAGEIEKKRIPGVNDEFVVSMVQPQPSHDVAIEFHHMQLTHSLQQRTSQCFEARPDLDHAIVGERPDGGDNPLYHRLIGEEMLAEALSRRVRQDRLRLRQMKRQFDRSHDAAGVDF